MKKEMKPVLVTTEYRGVFFGWLEKYEVAARRVTLTKIRNIIHWSGTRGFLGLASHGPEKDSRIGAEAPRAALHGVTSVTDCTEEAVQTFESWK